MDFVCICQCFNVITKDEKSQVVCFEGLQCYTSIVVSFPWIGWGYVFAYDIRLKGTKRHYSGQSQIALEIQ